MGYFVLRANFDDPHRRARVGALLALLGVADLPLIVLATRWFRGVHPVAPEMDPRMRLTLAVAGVSLLAFFAVVAFVRRQQLASAEHFACLESQENIHG
jgi:heme exporter protein C